jgi:hypothetical protein
MDGVGHLKITIVQSVTVWPQHAVAVRPNWQKVEKYPKSKLSKKLREIPVAVVSNF